MFIKEAFINSYWRILYSNNAVQMKENYINNKRQFY